MGPPMMTIGSRFRRSKRVPTGMAPMLTLVFSATLLWSTDNQAAGEAEQWASYPDSRLAEFAASGQDAPDLTAHLATGLRRLWSGDEDSAVAAFRLALSFDRESAPAHLFLAMALNNQALAIAYMGDLPQSGRTPVQRSIDDRQSELFAEADRHFDRALSLEPADPYALVSQTNALFHRSSNNPLRIPLLDPSPILAGYQRSLDAEPDYWLAKLGLAEALYAYALAYRAVFNRHPNPSMIADWLPDDLDGQADAYLAQAIAHYGWLIERRPDDESLYSHAIEALGALQRFEEAIALCKQAIDRFPATRTGRKAHRLWGEMLALPDFPPGGSMEARRAEHATYQSRLAQ